MFIEKYANIGLCVYTIICLYMYVFVYTYIFFNTYICILLKFKMKNKNNI